MYTLVRVLRIGITENAITVKLIKGKNKADDAKEVKLLQLQRKYMV